MKGKKLLTGLAAGLLLNLAVPVFGFAESLESLQEQENTVMQQSQAISAEVQLALNDVNQKYNEVAALKEKIADNEAAITQMNEEMKQTQETIQKREAVVAERMKAIQLNGGATRDWTALLESSSIQEFINRAYAMTVLQNLEKEKIESLTSEQQKLEQLKTNSEKAQVQLANDQASVETEAQQLNEKVGNLQTQLKEKQSVLQQISQSKAMEEARIAAEKAAAEQAAKEQAAQEKAAAEQAVKDKADAEQNAKQTETQPANQKNNTTNNSGSTTPPPVINEQSSGNNVSQGKTMMMESTAYSYNEPGASYLTATGSDLRKNPTAIAVDPTVIPLGSVVEVQGYGVAVALDTGGAIKGNIIDVHFASVDQCRQWGRRQVQVTVIS